MAKPTMKVRKGDTVLVIAGKDRGAKGKVLAAQPEKQRVIVEGVNRVKKHTPRRMASGRGGTTGGIVTQEAPIHVSNVMVLDGEGRRTRVGFRHDEDGKKVRFSRRTKEEISPDSEEDSE